MSIVCKRKPLPSDATFTLGNVLYTRHLAIPIVSYFGK